MIDITLTNGQTTLAKLNPLPPAKGKTAGLLSIPHWSVESGDVNLRPSHDGLSCVIEATPLPTVALVMVTARAQSGLPDVPSVTVSDLVRVTVTNTGGSSLGLSVDAPLDTFAPTKTDVPANPSSAAAARAAAHPDYSKVAPAPRRA